MMLYKHLVPGTVILSHPNTSWLIVSNEEHGAGGCTIRWVHVNESGAALVLKVFRDFDGFADGLVTIIEAGAP
jgi:hypothetical protein